MLFIDFFNSFFICKCCHGFIYFSNAAIFESGIGRHVQDHNLYLKYHDSILCSLPKSHRSIFYINRGSSFYGIYHSGRTIFGCLFCLRSKEKGLGHFFLALLLTAYVHRLPKRLRIYIKWLKIFFLVTGEWMNGVSVWCLGVCYLDETICDSKEMFLIVCGVFMGAHILGVYLRSSKFDSNLDAMWCGIRVSERSIEDIGREQNEV